MALSGTLTGTCDNTNYTLTCEWTAKQSITDNTSTVTAKVYLKAPSGWSTDSSYWDCTINGTQVTSDKDVVVGGTKVLLGQRSWTVNHNSDGTCSVKISFSYSNGLTSKGTYTTKTGSGSGTVTLDTIPRVSSFTLSSSSLEMGSSQTITISRASSSFTHTVAYTFGSTTTTVVTKTTSTSVSLKPPVSLASQVPNATSGTCTVKVTTYSGSTSIGSVTKTFTLKVPSSVVPTLSLAQTKNNTLGGVCISGKSTVKITPTGNGSYGSTIKSYSYSGAGLSGTGSNKTTGTLNAGDYTVTVTVTDSRGRTATSTTKFTVYNYSNPTCKISGYRANSSGTATATGTYVRLKLNWTISNPNSTNSNTKKFTIQYKKKTDTSWTTHTSSTTLSSYTGSLTSWNVSDVVFETTTSYDFKFTVTDSYGSASATCTVSTINAILNMERNGVGIGKIYEQGKLDINGDTCITNGTLKFTNSPSMYSRIGYSLETENSIGCTYISNGNNNWLRLKDDGTITWKGNQILTESGTQTISGGLNCGQFSDTFYCTTYKRKTTNTGNIMTKIGISYVGNESAMAIEVGKHDGKETFTLQRRYRFSVSSFTASEDNVVTIGTPDKRCKAIYSANGTVQTSDERYKFILENIDDEKCFDLIKNTVLYGYSTLNKCIDTYESMEEISNELKESSKEDINLHMGFIAQDVEDNELGKYIIRKDILTDDSGISTGECIYGIDNYAYTTAIHGALKHEISVREREIDGLKQQIKDLQQQIKQLSE